jgi:hypothetical protein
MFKLILENDEKELRQEYLSRFILAVSFCVIIGVIVFMIVFLIPAYFEIVFKNKEIYSREESIKNSNLVKKRTEMEYLAKSLQSRVDALQRNNPEAYKMFNILDETKDPNITINSVIFNEKEDGGYTVSVRGIAQNRLSLLNYSEKLKEKKDYIEFVEVPDSNFVKESQIPFIINLGLYGFKI